MFSILTVVILSFIVFLFSLYRLTKEDFIFLRKNIQLEEIFNFGFLLGLFSLFSARTFYAFIYGNKNWLNPLVFLFFTHFRGLSLLGVVVGGTIFSFLYLRGKKLPVGHIFDFTVLSFLASVSFGSIVNFIFIKKPDFPFDLIFPLLSLILVLVSFVFYRRARFEDGSFGILFLALFTFILYIHNHILRKISFSLGKEDFILIILFLVFALLFIKEEKLLGKTRR